MNGTPGKTDNYNSSSTPCNNAGKKIPSTNITNEILTEEELKKQLIMMRKEPRELTLKPPCEV